MSPTEPVTPISSFNADHNANLIIYYGHKIVSCPSLARQGRDNQQPTHKYENH